MLKEFKEFALKGNIIDMAIGVVIGGAFQKIVNSLVNDIIMPLISILIGKVDFSDMVLTVGNASIKYGSFITTIVDFLIIAFSIFIAIKYFNKLNKIKDISEEMAVKLDKKGNVKKYIKEKKKEENNTGVNQSFKLSVIVGIWESLNLHPTVMIYQSKRKYFLSMLHVSDNGQAKPAVYEIQKEDSRYFIVEAFKRLYISYDAVKDSIFLSYYGEYLRN